MAFYFSPFFFDHPVVYIIWITNLYIHLLPNNIIIERFYFILVWFIGNYIHRRNWAKILGGPNSSGPSKLALCKHNHAFSSFLNPLLLLKYNFGPSDVKFGTFWWQIWDLLGGPRSPLVALFLPAVRYR